MSSNTINENEIIETYKECKSMFKSAKLLKIPASRVRRILHKNNIEMDSKTYHIKYFLKDAHCLDNIDCEWKAYFLGFLYADGNVFKNTVRLGLQERDSYILHTFGNLLFHNFKITIKQKRKDTHQNLHILQITNTIITNSLKTWGVIPNKTFLTTFPQLPPHAIAHFIRGYFDGDGSIYKTGKTRFLLNILGSNAFIKSLSVILKDNNIENKILPVKKISRLVIGNKKELLKFFHYLYDSSFIHLNRKYEKFSEMIKLTDFEKLNKKKYSANVGVTFDKRRNKWYANIKIKNKKIHLGSFKTEQEAITARKSYDNLSS